MTARRYYTDPLAAAWMAKRHGMKLVQYATEEHAAEYDCPVGEEWDWMECCPPDCGGETINMVGEALAFLGDCGGRIYIHPDSLHLLEPQPLDHVEDASGVFRVPTSGNFNSHGPVRIIQRNGMAFHWPESEGA